MPLVKIGSSHHARKQLFQTGLRRGFLTVQEIETALPAGSLTAAERWLLYYSLRAAQIEVRDETGALVTVPALTADELEQLESERHAQNPAEQADEALGAMEPDEVDSAEEALGALESQEHSAHADPQ